MARAVLIFILISFLVRAFSKLWNGLMQGVQGPRARATKADRGIQMARDPVCGTFVVPERAVTLSVGRDQLYFCSPTCRDAYRARTA